MGIEMQAQRTVSNLVAFPNQNQGMASAPIFAAENFLVVWRSPLIRLFVKRGEGKIELFLSSGHWKC